MEYKTSVTSKSNKVNSQNLEFKPRVQTQMYDDWLADNCQTLAVRSDNCQIGQLSDRTTVSADNCQGGQLSVRTTVSADNCQCGQLSVRQLSVDHGQLSEETVSALKKL